MGASVIKAGRWFGWAASRRGVALAIMVGAMGALSACSWLHFGESDEDTYDYHKAKSRQEPLEVPPDLSQLPKDDRYALPTPANKAAAAPANAANNAGANGAQAGAAAAPQTVVAPAAPAPAANAVAPSGAALAPAAGPQLAVAAPAPASGSATAPAGLVVAPYIPGTHIVRDGPQRWLAVDVSPEVAYATIKDLWVSMGMKIKVDEPLVGYLETNWTEVRPDVGEDAVRSGLHFILGLFDSNGIRNKYRARIERTPRNTSEITITNEGMVEVYTSQAQDTTKWEYRAPDPELEALMLQRLALRFAQLRPLQVAVASSMPPAAPAPAVAAAPAPGEAPPAAAPAPAAAVASTAAGPVSTVDITPPPRVHKVTVGGEVTLQVEDTLDNTWRRVGIALDRGGFTIEERRRDTYTYGVGYLDPEYVEAERAKRSWWDRIFNADAPVPEQKFQIAVSANGATTAVTVRDKDGRPDSEPTARHILDQLQEQLRY